MDWEFETHRYSKNLWTCDQMGRWPSPIYVYIVHIYSYNVWVKVGALKCQKTSPVWDRPMADGLYRTFFLLVKSPFAAQITIFCWSNHCSLVKSHFFSGQITIFCWSNHHFLLVNQIFFFAGQITICCSNHNLLVKSPFAGQITFFLLVKSPFAGRITICWSNHIFLLVKAPFAGQITICWLNHIFLLCQITICWSNHICLLVKSPFAGQIIFFCCVKSPFAG